MSTREISVFVDESGSYEPDRLSSRYYLVCMVFHDQDVDITTEVSDLESSLAAMGLNREFCVHRTISISAFSSGRHRMHA